MDSQQAKQILELYRPGVDDSDPHFAEALAQAQRDPELRRWLDEHSALYSAIRAKLKAAPVASDLRNELLAERKTARRPVAWWRSPLAIGAAAAVAICLSIYSIVMQIHSREGRKDFSAFREEMVQFAVAGYEMEVRSDSFDTLRQQFVRNGWPSDYTLPRGVAKLSVKGGCLLSWKDHKVSMLCLHAPGDHDVWLYVVERKGLRGAPKQSTPQIAIAAGVPSASWSENGKAYLLATKGDVTFLRSLL